MARVHIEENFYMTIERLNVALEEKSIIKTGKQAGEEVFKIIGNYPTVKGAVKGLLRFKIADTTATTLGELIVHIDRVDAEIESLIKV